GPAPCRMPRVTPLLAAEFHGCYRRVLRREYRLRRDRRGCEEIRVRLGEPQVRPDAQPTTSLVLLHRLRGRQSGRQTGARALTGAPKYSQLELSINPIIPAAAP